MTSLPTWISTSQAGQKKVSPAPQGIPNPEAISKSLRPLWPTMDNSSTMLATTMT